MHRAGHSPRTIIPPSVADRFSSVREHINTEVSQVEHANLENVTIPEHQTLRRLYQDRFTSVAAITRYEQALALLRRVGTDLDTLLSTLNSESHDEAA